jgi:hypothetical protein
MRERRENELKVKQSLLKEVPYINKHSTHLSCGKLHSKLNKIGKRSNSDLKI